MHPSMSSALPGSGPIGSLPGQLNSSVSRLPMEKHENFSVTSKLPETTGMSASTVANSANPSSQSHIFGLPTSDISTFSSNMNEMPSLYSSLNSNGSGSLSNSQFSSTKRPPTERIVASHSSLPQVSFNYIDHVNQLTVVIIFFRSFVRWQDKLLRYPRLKLPRCHIFLICLNLLPLFSLLPRYYSKLRFYPHLRNISLKSSHFQTPNHLLRLQHQ